MYDEKQKRSNWIPCKEHRWPKSGPGGSLSGIGNVWYQQCNNCLSMKITFEVWYEDTDKEWKKRTEEKIVEPEFKDLRNDN